MRNERKFLTNHFIYNETEEFLLSNKFAMREIYYKRFINNIYFDTADYQFYRTNVEGEHSRLKVRIRWYGDLHNVENPVLEYKIKKGEIVTKKNYQIKFENLSEMLDPAGFMNTLKKTCDNSLVAEQMNSLRPTLINRYYRGYYLSKDECVRATIDDEVEFYSPETLSFFYKQHARIIELKYAPEDEKTAVNLSNTMPYRLTKNSKYVHGVSKLLWY